MRAPPFQTSTFYIPSKGISPQYITFPRYFPSVLSEPTLAMVWLAEETVPIPAKDILSWMFDDVPYDPDEPVPSSNLSL